MFHKEAFIKLNRHNSPSKKPFFDDITESGNIRQCRVSTGEEQEDATEINQRQRSRGRSRHISPNHLQLNIVDERDLRDATVRLDNHLANATVPVWAQSDPTEGNSKGSPDRESDTEKVVTH